MSSPSRTALITGASTGIGRATVAALVEAGYRVIAGVRRESDAEQLRRDFPEHVTPLLVDVTDAEQVAEAARAVQRLAPDGLAALINNAGIGAAAAAELTDLDEMRRLFEVNAVGALRMIQAMLPALRRGQGRIINLSSMNGVLSLPMTGAYSASKFALEAICNALRVELMPWKIPVVVIRPGQVRTPIFGKVRAAIERQRRDLPASLVAGYDLPYRRTAKFNDRGDSSRTPPEAVARVVLKALAARRPRPSYLVGWDALGMWMLHRYMPRRSLDRILGRAIGALRRRSRQEQAAVDAAAQSPAASPTGVSIGP